MNKNKSTLAFLKKALKPYLKQGYSFSPDTNFFMECPEIFHYLHAKKEVVLISKVTYDELDHGKNVLPEASEMEKQRAWKRRRGLEAMDKAGAVRVPTPSSSYMQGKKLGTSNDEKIIASYLQYGESGEGKVLYLTLDRGAKTIARSVNLPMVEFDITTFFDLKRQDESATQTTKTMSKSYGSKTKKQNPILRFFTKIFESVFALIVGIIRLCLFALVVLVVIALVMNVADNVKQTKAFNRIVGDQGTVALEVSVAKNDKNQNRFDVEVELVNHTSENIHLKGYYSQRELETKASLEKQTNQHSIRNLSLLNLKEGSHAVKITYKDGSEEVKVAHETLAPREKKRLVISSNGQLEDIDKIDLQYQVEKQEGYQLLTIDPH